MRSREDIENRILSLVDKYRHLFVRVVLFGSYARNQQGKESDIDLFIESDIPTNKLITSTAYNRFHDELYEEFDYTVPFDLLGIRISFGTILWVLFGLVNSQN